MEKKKIIIDTDIGDDIDDAFAIALAMASPELEILGVTTVYKNVGQRAHIVKNLLCAGGRGDIPVLAGCNDPLKQPVVKFDYETIGEDGLPALRHYHDNMKAYRYDGDGAEEFILSEAERYPGEITLVGIGPLTNLAKAYGRNPEAFGKLKEIVLMSGCFTEEYPEWNVMCDPEATRIVYGCGVPVRAVGVNCTCRTEVEGENLEKLRAIGGACGALLNGMLDIWLADNNRNCVMHDGLAIASLYDDYITFERQNIYVPLEEGARGYSLRLLDETPVTASMEVSTAVDAEKFMNSFTDRLLRFTNSK